jgi:hypothetical protein
MMMTDDDDDDDDDDLVWCAGEKLIEFLMSKECKLPASVPKGKKEDAVSVAKALLTAEE